MARPRKTTRGEQLREAILADFEVEGVAEETMLDLICRTADEVETLERALDEHGPVIPGARGQLVRNPALDAIVKHRKLLADLIVRAFPQPDDHPSAKARKAARARWNR